MYSAKFHFCSFCSCRICSANFAHASHNSAGSLLHGGQVRELQLHPHGGHQLLVIDLYDATVLYQLPNWLHTITRSTPQYVLPTITDVILQRGNQMIDYAPWDSDVAGGIV